MCNPAEFHLATINSILNRMDALNRILWALDQFGNNLTLASSLGPQSIVLTHILKENKHNPDIFFLDTGRLPAETYQLLDECMRFFDIKYRVFCPDQKDTQEYIREYGPNAFYRNKNLRKRCCELRKLNSMERALKDYDMWITGARRDQTSNRGAMEILEWDNRYDLYKFNPLADWTEDMVWEYISDHELPYNKLHDQGYTSIGCAPCTRAVDINEDPRAGRWWWETDSDSECGMHIIGNGNQPSEIVNLEIINIFEEKIFEIS